MQGCINKLLCNTPEVTWQYFTSDSVMHAVSIENTSFFRPAIQRHWNIGQYTRPRHVAVAELGLDTQQTVFKNSSLNISCFEFIELHDAATGSLNQK